LTARYLAEVEREVARIATFLEENDRLTDAWWREPILLMGGYLYVTASDVAADLVRRLAYLDMATPPCTARALVAAELSATIFLEWGGAETTQQALANRLAALLTDPALPNATPPQRAAAGRALARLGDPRDGVGRRGAVPDLAWCAVPGGPFLLGANDDEEGAYDDEKPQHELTLSTFYIARYPITNAQFAPFVEGGGYDNPQWWTTAGWEWRNGAEPDLSSIAEENLRNIYADWFAQRPAARRHEPLYWHDERLNLPNQPVVGVNWYEVMAYCAWLQQQWSVSGQPFAVAGGPVYTLLANRNWQVRLPTEAEWEKAAGWDPATQRKRVYAWGNMWDKTKANVDNNIGQPSAVGIFPAGASACGAMDMTGNVWEWTLSQVEDYPYQNDIQYRLESTKKCTLRGGAWNYVERHARVSCRRRTHPANFSVNAGFRVVVAPVL